MGHSRNAIGKSGRYRFLLNEEKNEKLQQIRPIINPTTFNSGAWEYLIKLMRPILATLSCSVPFSKAAVIYLTKAFTTPRFKLISYVLLFTSDAHTIQVLDQPVKGWL